MRNGYTLEPTPENQYADECGMQIFLEGHPQITLEKAEGVLSELGWNCEHRIITTAQEDVGSSDMVYADKYSPGAFFRARPTFNDPNPVKGRLVAFLRFPVDVPVGDREEYAMKAFDVWKRYVALYLTNLIDERICIAFTEATPKTD